MSIEIKQAIENHLPKILDKISIFYNTGYSFEEWINWELYYSAIKADLEATPKPSYKMCQPGKTKSIGDLLVSNRFFIEVACIHDFTGDKWIKKIDADRRALEELDGSDIIPLQILFLVSKHKELENHENWKPWLEKICFWNEDPIWNIVMALPKGEVAVKCWSVSG